MPKKKGIQKCEAALRREASKCGEGIPVVMQMEHSKQHKLLFLNASMLSLSWISATIFVTAGGT